MWNADRRGRVTAERLVYPLPDVFRTTPREDDASPIQRPNFSHFDAVESHPVRDLFQPHLFPNRVQPETDREPGASLAEVGAMMRFRTPGLITAALWFLLLPIAPQFAARPQQRTKPILYVWEADWCDGCKEFQSDWPLLSPAIQSRYTVRSMDYDRDQRNRAIQRVTKASSFVIYDGRGYRLVFVGYRNDDQTRRQLLAYLGFPRGTLDQLKQRRPVTRPASRSLERATQKPATSDRVRQLQTQLEKSQRELAAERNKPNACDPTVVRELQTRISDLVQQVNRERRSASELVQSQTKSLRDEVAELRRRQAQPDADPWPQIPATRPGTEKPSTPQKPATQDPGGGWFGSLLKGAAYVAVKVGLPASAGPPGLGLSALSVAGVAFEVLRRRRKKKLLGSHIPATTDPQQPDTVNHYVHKPTDRLGEAYKEAIRRVAAMYRDDQPAIVDVLNTLESVAKQIFEGEQIASRDHQRPGLWSD